jgi:transcriptional regulator with XRE-family HTH domain
MEILLSKDYILGLVEHRGMSKAEFAKQMGIVRQNLDAMLESKKKDINTVIRMAEVLGLSLDEFLYGKQTVKINGFVSVDDTIYTISQKSDLQRVLANIEKLEKTLV